MAKRAHVDAFGRSPPSGNKRAKRVGAGVMPRVRLPAPLRSNAPEIKAVDYTTTPINISTSVTFNTVNLPVEGSSFYNRIGRKITMKSLHIRGYIYPTLTNTTEHGPQYCRFVVIYDAQPNGAVPAIADIFLDYNAAGSTFTGALSGLNMNNRDRFTVLRDRKILLPSIGIAGAASANPSYSVDPVLKETQLNLEEFIKLKDLTTQFKASAGAIGDIATGALYVFCMCEDPSDPAWKYKFYSRLRYGDS